MGQSVAGPVSELMTRLESISIYHHKTQLSEKQRVDRRVTYRFSSQARLLLQRRTPIAVRIACRYL